MAPPPPRDPAGDLAAVLGILRVRPQHACPWQGVAGGVDRASSDTTLQSILSLRPLLAARQPDGRLLDQGGSPRQEMPGPADLPADQPPDLLRGRAVRLRPEEP